MRITVFGATGGSGGHFVRQALDDGHEIVAVVRDPSRFTPPPGTPCRVVVAQLADPVAVAAAVKGSDAVVSALGPRPGDKAGICSAGVSAIIRAMDETGVRRLIVLSASGAFVDDGDNAVTRWLAKPLLGLVLRDAFRDVRVMEGQVRASGLDWTIMRPPRLSNREHTGRYRTAVDRNVRGGLGLSRADVADAIRQALRDPATIGHSIAMAY